MKRWLISLAVGALPVCVLLMVIHEHGKKSEPETQDTIVAPALATPRPDASEERSDAGDALEMLENLEAAVDSPELKLAFERFAELDLVAALDYADSTWPLPERIGIIRTSVLRWAVEDIDACWAWIEQTEGSLAPDEIGRRTPWNRLLISLFEGRALATPSPGETERTWRELESCSAALASDLLHPHNGVFFDPVTKRPAGAIWTLVNATRQSGDWSVAPERMLRLPNINTPIMFQLAHGWMAEDMDAAVRWALATPDPKQRVSSQTSRAGPGSDRREHRAVRRRTDEPLASGIAGRWSRE